MKNFFAFVALISLLVLYSKSADAQIANVQKLLLDDANGLYISLDSRLEWRAGNTDFLSVGGNTLLKWNMNRHSLLFSAHAKYSKTDDNAFVRSVFEHFRYMYQIVDILGLEGFLQHEYDEATRTRVRALVGGGPRITVKSKVFNLFVGSSYMLEYMLYTLQSGVSDSGDSHLYHRWSNYITLTIKLNDSVHFIHTTYIQPRFDDFNDFRALLESAFSIYISKHMRVSIRHTYTYNSKPAEDIKPYDSALTVGIGFSWGPLFADTNGQK